MSDGTTLCIGGEFREETAVALRERLLEMGHRAEIISLRLAQRIGSQESRTLVCDLLTRNGVIVLVTTDQVSPPNGHLTMTAGVHDTPDFAAEKALDLLAERGVIQLDSSAYSPEEEEQVRQRLADLGYVE